MTIWFTSDTHFGHKNIIKYAGRPYESVEEMDAALIENWNSVIGPKDEVFHLGDIAWHTGDELEKILRQLHGIKRLLLGNHDHGVPLDLLHRHFVEVAHYRELKLNKQKIILFHYPIFSWNGMHKGAWQLHGHSHGNVNYANENTTRLDVGSDVHNWTPINFERVEEILGDKVVELVDHHGTARD